MKKEVLTKEEVLKVAKLANLTLSAEEIEKFRGQMQEIIDYNVELLKDVKTEGVEPSLQAEADFKAARKDETEPSISSEEAVSNAKETHNDLFKVKSVFD